ncbi:hypothetical protein FACS1894167_02260 [Synergistales bacterium]|nr:hypothetical protein FACS1894167_02260 [Synergistales bacterium]
MKNRIWYAVILAVVMLSASCAPLRAGEHISDEVVARKVASLLGKEFTPERITVTVLDSRLYAEMTGGVISDIRIDSMKIEALISNRESVLSDDAEALASLIGYSKGEMVMLEKDVNEYFAKNESGGFSKLVFDFLPGSFKAEGLFSADFLFKLRIRLAANGTLGLASDGINLSGVAIFIEGVKQPSFITEQIVSGVNPLIAWRDIPFKVEFKTVTIEDTRAVMSGNPKKFPGGSTAVWKK